MHDILSRQLKLRLYLIQAGYGLTFFTAEVNMIMQMTTAAIVTGRIGNITIYICDLMDQALFQQTVQHSVDRNAVAQIS
ncbi:hypothetical protein D3C86_1691590 [compost metagenome]